MKILLTFFLLTISLTIFGQKPQTEPNSSKEIANWRSANYSDIKYKLDITLDKGTPLMYGMIEISVKLTDEGAKRDLILDWRTTQFQNDKDRPFANVQKVNGTLFLYGAIQPKNEQLVIPKSALKAGENLIKIQFASQIKTGESATVRYIDKEDSAEYIYSQFSVNKNTPFPVFDQSDLKARFSLHLDIPKAWKAISNSSTRENDTVLMGGQARTAPGINFRETKPISTYVFAFAAGDFAEIKDEADIGLVKTAPIGSTKIYEPLKNPNAAKVYVRKSQEQKFRQYAAEFFLLNPKKEKFAKLDIILLPEIFNTQSDYDGIKFVPENSVFR